MAKNANNTVIEKTAMLDKSMQEVFDWAKDDKRPVRVAIWDFEMEKNEHDTMKTEAACEWELKASDDELTKFAEENLKK